MCQYWYEIIWDISVWASYYSQANIIKKRFPMWAFCFYVLTRAPLSWSSGLKHFRKGIDSTFIRIYSTWIMLFIISILPFCSFIYKCIWGLILMQRTYACTLMGKYYLHLSFRTTDLYVSAFVILKATLALLLVPSLYTFSGIMESFPLPFFIYWKQVVLKWNMHDTYSRIVEQHRLYLFL